MSDPNDITAPPTRESETPLLPEELQSPSRMRSVVRGVKAWAGVKAMGLTAVLPPKEPHAIGVVNYHRVHPKAGLPISLTPTAFRRQLGGLVKRGYRGIRVSELCDLTAGSQPLPEKTFAVTFDDGFENVLRHALPVLRDLGVPATVMLTTGGVGRDRFEFDPLVYSQAGPDRLAGPSLREAVRPLTLDGCLELLDSGLFEIGCHTHTHRDFTQDPAAFEDDMRRSLDWLETNLGVTSPTFSYPYGGADPALREQCRDLGVRCGLTTDADLIRPGTDPMNWGRFGGDEYDTGATLAAKVEGWYAAARRTWRRAVYGEKPSTVAVSLNSGATP